MNLLRLKPALGAANHGQAPVGMARPGLMKLA